MIGQSCPVALKQESAILFSSPCKQSMRSKSARYYWKNEIFVVYSKTSWPYRWILLWLFRYDLKYLTISFTFLKMIEALPQLRSAFYLVLKMGYFKVWSTIGAVTKWR